MNEVTGFEDTIAWYNANAEKYAENIQEIPSNNLLNTFSDLLPLGAKVLDAGCAGGRDCGHFALKGLNPVGVDISEELLAIARSRYREIDFVEGNFLALPFKNETFEGVWAHASLLHFETPEPVILSIKEFNRVLRPKGVLHVYVKQQLGEAKTEVLSDKLSGHDRFFQWFTSHEINNFLVNSGFTVINIVDGLDDPAGRNEVKWIAAFAKKIS